MTRRIHEKKNEFHEQDIHFVGDTVQENFICNIFRERTVGQFHGCIFIFFSNMMPIVLEDAITQRNHRPNRIGREIIWRVL